MVYLKSLIIGGNRFFGKKLARLLLKKGHQVTLVNRGNVDDGFEHNVSRITCDRNDKTALKKAVLDQHWDLVFDQVCFDYDTAKNACEVFEGKVRKYIFTSTQSVYKPGKNLTEKNFNVDDYKITTKYNKNENYGEAKRQAELAFKENSTFPVVSVRLPIVIGEDDYTKRFNFHVERIREQKEIYFPNIQARLSLITSDDAARSLLFLAESEFTGAINVASPDPIRLKDLVEIIEKNVDKKVIIASNPTDDNHSPYGIDSDWFADCSLLSEHGLVLSEIKNSISKFINYRG